MTKALLGIALAGAVGAIFYLGAAAVARGTAHQVVAQAEPINVKINGREEEYDVHGKHMTLVARDIYAMSGFDLDRVPYMEASNRPAQGAIPGINFTIPDGSRWGWRFISRVTETNLTTRAFIDAGGNADFTGTVRGQSLRAGTPGLYTPAALTWGNHLGGDFVSTLFSSDSVGLYGVKAQVFGISYNNTAVLTQDAYGNVAMFGNVAAKQFSAAKLQAADSSITAGRSAPKAGCSVGDLYMRKDGSAGTTLYSCTSADTWSPVDGHAASAPQFSSAQFASRSLAAAPTPTTLATATLALSASSGPKGDWYVCSIVEATVQAESAADRQPTAVTFGIGTPSAGTGTAFRMYSRPKNDRRNAGFSDAVLSDWETGLSEAAGDGVQNATSSGRYCNTYPNGATLSFTAYVLPSAGVRPDTVYTSGEIDIQATPQ
jgi:hypothetical protein